MNLTVDELELSYPVKYIASLMMKKGAVVTRMPGTKMVKMKFNSKEYFFAPDAHPAIPYMYGIIFSTAYFWRQIVRSLHIPFVYTKPSGTTPVSVFVTRDGFYNALSKKPSVITGDGKTSVRKLIARENMKRINESSKTVFPISTGDRTGTSAKILPKGKVLSFDNSIDYTDVTSVISKTYIEACERMLDELPGLPYITIKLYTKNISSAQKYSVGTCDLTGGMNVFVDATNGKSVYNAGGKIVDALTGI
jgi:hypothetical protein